MRKLLLTCAGFLLLVLLVVGCGHDAATGPDPEPEPTCDRALALEVLDPGQPIDSGSVTSWSYQGDDLLAGDSVTLTFTSPDSVATVVVVDSTKNVQRTFNKLGLWKFESFVHLVGCEAQTTRGTFTVVGADPEDPPTCELLGGVSPDSVITGEMLTAYWSYNANTGLDSVLVQVSDSGGVVIQEVVAGNPQNYEFQAGVPGLYSASFVGYFEECTDEAGPYNFKVLPEPEPEMTCELTASLAEEVLFVGDRQVVVWSAYVENTELDSVLVIVTDSAGVKDSTVYYSGQQHAFYVPSPGRWSVDVTGFFGECGVVSVGPLYFDVNIMPVGSATLIACPYYQLKDTTNILYKVVRDDQKIKVAGKLFYQNWNMEQPWGPVYEVDWGLDFWLTIAHQQSGKILVWFEGQDEAGQDVRTDGIWVYRVGEYQELRMWVDWPRDVSVGDSVLVRFGGYEAPDEELMQYLVSAETFTIIDGERVANPFLDVDVENRQFTFVFDTPGERLFAIVLHLDTDEDGAIDLIITGELLHVSVY